MLKRTHAGMRSVALVAVCVAGIASAEEREQPPPVPSAARLVQQVIDEEAQVDKVHSLFLRFRARITRTPEAIAKIRAKLERTHPTDTITPQLYSELRPEVSGELVFAWDDHRVAKTRHWHEVILTEEVWNGRKVVTHWKYFTHDQEQYSLDDSIARTFDSTTLFDLYWLRMAPPKLWWLEASRSRNKELRPFGIPEDYVVVKEREYRDRKCLELKNRSKPHARLYIGQADQRLRGMVLLRMPSWEDTLTALSKIVGREIKNDEQYAAWEQSQTPEQRAQASERMIDEYGTAMTEFYLDDYRQVGPSLWIPHKQGHLSRDGVQVELELVEARVDVPLDDNLFEIELRDGVKVYDRGHEPPLFYEQKASRTADEWRQIVETHRQRNEGWKKEEAARNALIGQPAPALPESKWFNSEPLTWEAMRGKVVLLHFWSVSCGPCHSNLLTLSSYKPAAKDDLVIIGVHDPGYAPAEIEKKMTRYKLGYPILVDVRCSPEEPETWGLLSKQLGVTHRPHATVVDADGKIAAHGDLHTMLEKAYELTKRKK